MDNSFTYLEFFVSLPKFSTYIEKKMKTKTIFIFISILTEILTIKRFSNGFKGKKD